MNIFRLRALVRRHGLAASIAAAAGLSIGAPGVAQDVYDEHYEWEADEGVHEEEWYDPSDWWDDDTYERQVDYESDWYETGWGDDDYGYGYGESYDEEPDWDDGEYWDAEPDEDDRFGYGMYRYDYGFDDEYRPDEYRPAVRPGERSYERGYDDAYGWDWEGDDLNTSRATNYDEYWGPDDWDSPYEYRRMRGVLHQDAARQQRGQARDQARDRWASSQSAQRPDVQLRGEIEDWKRVELRGQRDPHTLVRLELEDGEEAIVNLGPNVSLSRLDLEEDDDIVVLGRMSQINGRDVVMARGIRVDGRTIRMNSWSSNQQMQGDQRREGYSPRFARRDRDQIAERDRRSQQMQRDQQRREMQRRSANRDRQPDFRESWSMGSPSSSQQAQRDQQRREMQRQQAQRDQQRRDQERRQASHDRTAELRGELTDWSRVTLQGHRDSHTLVKMKLDDGSQAIVDLGPNTSISRLNLSEGDRVAVFGPVGAINDRDVVMAMKIRVDGRTISMNNWSPKSHQRDSRQSSRSGQPSGDQQRGQSDQRMTSSQRDRDQAQRDQQRQRDQRTASRNRLSDQERLQTQLFGSSDQRSRSGSDQQLENQQRQAQQRDPDQRTASSDRSSRDQRMSGQYGPYTTQQASDQSRRSSDQRQAQRSASSQQDSRAQQRERDQRRVVQRVMSDWPEPSQEAVKSMLEKYGLPAGITPEMMIWRDTGPFVKTIVHANPVQHNFPMQHKDVLEQFVNFQVPAERMDELAKFDGSIIVYRTDGLMSARCHKEAMNVLALNLAADVAEEAKTVEEARRKYAQTAQAYKQGDRPKITQRLAFNSKRSNTSSNDWSDQRFEREQTSMR